MDESDNEQDGADLNLHLPPLAAAAAAAVASSFAIVHQPPPMSPRSPPSPLNPSAAPYEPRAVEESEGTPDWLRYSASLDSVSDAMDTSPWSLSAAARTKGKAITSSRPGDFNTTSYPSVASGFMADTRRAWGGSSWRLGQELPAVRRHAPVSVAIPAAQSSAVNLSDDGDEGWTEVRRWHRSPHRDPPVPRPAPWPVPANLVGRCFNFLASYHVAAICRNPSRCLRCGQEGHMSHQCKRRCLPLPYATAAFPASAAARAAWPCSTLRWSSSILIHLHRCH
ncbi:unnamed protein product [Urochloa humidicola]